MRIYRVLAFVFLLAGLASAQSTTSITGTIRDGSGALITSGQVAFTLQPGIDTVTSGIARFTPTEVDCTINGSGLVKALDGVSVCTLVQNTSAQPTNTSYKACIQPSFVTPGSCFVFYATGSTLDITTVPATPSLTPAYNLVDTFSNQTIAGNKTFTGTVNFGPLSNPVFNSVTTSALAVKGPHPWVDVTAFGAIGDGVTDSTTAIQQAINFACSGLTIAPVNATCTSSTESDVLIPQGTYKTTACLQMYGSTNLIGAGRLTSVIAKSNNVNCTAGSIAAPARALNDNYAVDAIMAVVHPISDYAYHWKVSGVGLKNTGSASTYGIYSPRASQSELDNSYIANTGTGFYSNDNWLMTIRHTTVDTANFGYRWADDGSGINSTGTALTLDNVWAVNIALSCYNIFGLNYSSFNNTACDSLNVSNVDNANIDLSYAAYGFKSSNNITLNGAGAEAIHGSVLSSQSSSIAVNAMRALSVTGYTSAAGSPAYIVANGSTLEFHASTFDAMTSPGSFFNFLSQSGSLVTASTTTMPTGGNTFNNFSGGSLFINISLSGITLTSVTGSATLGPTFQSFPETTAPSAAAALDKCYGDSAAHALECSYNNSAFSPVVRNLDLLTPPPIGTTTPNAIKATTISETNMLISNAAPTISSGFGTSPSIVNQNGTAAFAINVGTGGTANSGTIGLPASVNGWNCFCFDSTTTSATVAACKQTNGTTSSAIIGNLNTSAAAAAWVASDILQISCFAR